MNRILGKPKNKCGVNNFACGICPGCVKKEEARWNQIWEQKYGAQEREYYSKPSYLRGERSLTRSTLDIDLPIHEEVYFILSADTSPHKIGGRGTKRKTPESRKASSPA